MQLHYYSLMKLSLFQLFVVFAALFSVIMYRMAVAVTMFRYDSEFIKTNAKLVTSITAATINLVIIIIGNIVSLTIYI